MAYASSTTYLFPRLQKRRHSVAVSQRTNDQMEVYLIVMESFQCCFQSHISIVQGGFQYKLNSDACTIISYPAIEEKHI